MMGLYKKRISSFFFFFLHLMTSHDGFHVIFSFRSSFQIHGHSTQCPGFTQCCVVPPHPGAVVLMGLCLFSMYFPLSHIRFFHFSSIQWVSSFSCLVDCAIAMFCPSSSFAQSCPTLCGSMDCSMPGFPVHHQFLEPAQTHVHQVSDATQLSHPLPSPSPPTFNLSQHQDLFKWVSSSHQVTKVLEFQLQHQSFQWTPRTDLL